MLHLSQNWTNLINSIETVKRRGLSHTCVHRCVFSVYISLIFIACSRGWGGSEGVHASSMLPANAQVSIAPRHRRFNLLSADVGGFYWVKGQHIRGF